VNYATLTDELRDDPLSLGYASMTDAEAAESLGAPGRQVVVPTRCTWRDLMAALGLQQAADVKTRLEAAAETDEGLALALHALGHYGEGGGLDFGHPQTRDTIDALAADNVLTSDEAAAVKALAERTVSRAEELGLARVRPGHVQKARALLT